MLDGARCPLSVVVLSVGAPADLTEAVQSLLDQRPRPLVVVVNSGGGDVQGRLDGLAVDTVLETPDLLSHGAARNVGVSAATSPYVAFLSADCRPSPGWVAARLRRHGAGERAVSSAVVNRHPRRRSAWASHALLFSRRMPAVDPSEALLYGVSYDRRLFEELGGFDESLSAGEDTEFHSRIRVAGVRIVWEPDVQTQHPHPTSFRQLLKDQRNRGRRSATVWRELGGPTPRQVARTAFTRSVADIARAWRCSRGAERRRLLSALPLMPPAILAYSWGAARVGGAW